MQDTKILAHCEDCGHAYKVPSAERTYHCKECGGTVRCDLDEDEEGIEEELEVHMPEHRSIRDRHPAQKKPIGKLIGFGAIIVLGLIGMIGYGLGWFGFLTGAEKNLNKVVASFVVDWQAGDKEALVGYYHPNHADDFRTQLNKVMARRGWQAGMPTVTKSLARVTKGTVDDPETGAAELSFKGIGTGAEDVDGWARIEWQYEPSNGHWYIFSFILPPPPLMPRAEAFREAWNGSNLASLAPFFGKKRADKMTDILQKAGKKAGWLGAHPAASVITIEGEDEARSTMAFVIGGKVYTYLETTADPLALTWVFDRAEDEWFANGYKSFP